MRSRRVVLTGVATATLAVLLTACNASPGSSSADRQSKPSAVSTPTKATPAPKTTSATPSAQPSGTSHHSAGSTVCAKLPASAIQQIVDPQNKAGKLITATSVNAVTGVSDPTYCEYHTAQGGTIGVGTLSSADSADAWNRLKDRHEEEPIQGLGGDEATTLGAGLYMIRKGDISITVQGMPSGLDTPTLERIVRAAVAVL